MKNIIFDWSGVVKDAVHVQLWLVNRVFVKHGLEELSIDEFRENWVQPHHLFYAKYLPDISLEEEAKDYREGILSSDCPVADSCVGVVELIKRLKDKGFFLAVVSSDLPETLLPEMKRFGLENIFNEVINGVDDKFEPVESLIKNHNLNPLQTYFIGDSNHEIAVSKKYGIKSIAVTWGFCSEQLLIANNPDFLVNDVKALEDILF